MYLVNEIITLFTTIIESNKMYIVLTTVRVNDSYNIDIAIQTCVSPRYEQLLCSCSAHVSPRYDSGSFRWQISFPRLVLLSMYIYTERRPLRLPSQKCSVAGRRLLSEVVTLCAPLIHTDSAINDK